MTCERCGADNRAGRKFCSQCGVPLALGCPSCGAPNEAGERFCGECGAPLAVTASAAPARSAEPRAAERRLVSVLFADLVGFTALSEVRDPEEVRELLTRYFDVARDVIARYGGEVEKFIGDAIMAVWGAPVAHEDDAERAVRAGLELVDAVAALGAQVGAPDLRLRAGVLTGEAAVTVGAQGQGMVAGDLVNTAARLQAAAAPGTVLAGEATYLAANKGIAFEDAGAHAVKGKELPVKAWRARGAVAGAGGFRRRDALEAPFVGRDEELRLLKDLVHATARETRLRLVSVTGIGGIGKSRLAWELFKYIDGVKDLIYWHEGRCPAYGEGVTFWALGEMVRMRARISETEDAAASRHKLAVALEDYVADDGERRWIEPRLAHLLGLGERPSGERDELFAAWRTFFERVSERGPTVMVFEDLQWADPGLIDFIEHTLEWARAHPILIVTLARPELLEKRPTWGAGQRNLVSVHLEPLGEEAMRKLLGGLAHALPDHLAEHIIERSEGVPLYAIETVRMLVDQGRLVAEDGAYRVEGELAALEVPDSLQSLIASRLDGLDPANRELLQDASVLGKTFTVEALNSLRGEAPETLQARLRELVRRELLVVENDPRSPEHGHHGFTQSLVREVAHQTLSRPDRHRRHLAAARYFEALDDDELAGVVATHYMEAYRTAPAGAAADALESHARGVLTQAAVRASSLGAFEQAEDYLEQAIDITSDPGERAALWEQAGEAAGRALRPEESRTYFEQALAWHERRDDGLAVARAAAGLCEALTGMGKNTLALLERAYAGVADRDVDETVVRLMLALAWSYFFALDHRRANEWADKGLVAAERLELVEPLAGCLQVKGLSVRAGRPREAIALLRGAVALAEESGLVAEQLRAQVNLSDSLLDFDARAALEQARPGIEVAARAGDRGGLLFLAGNACEAALRTGEWDWVEATVADVDHGELPLGMRVWMNDLRSRLDVFRGELETARQRVAATGALAAASEDPQDISEFRDTEAWLALADGRLDDAFDKAMEAADSLAAAARYGVAGRAAVWLGDRSRVELVLAKLTQGGFYGPMAKSHRRSLEGARAALEGDREEASTRYQEAIRGWRELGLPLDEGLTGLDLVTLAGPEDPTARASAAEARTVFERLGARPFLARLDATLSDGDLA
jgi:class 3 adenylate cyclase/tetratricopeptide (TPR) repeat protein